MPKTLRVVVPPHPLIAHWLTILRNPSTPAPLYSTGLEQIGKWLTYEALRDWLPHRTENIETNQGKIKGEVIEAGVPLIALPNLPGGLELWQGGRDVLPNAHLWLGDIPETINQKSGIILYIDQITNGETLLKKIQVLKNKNLGTKQLRVITAIAASPGLKKIGEMINYLTIYCTCIDPDIDEHGQILPGIGNPTKRINARFKGPN